MVGEAKQILQNEIEKLAKSFGNSIKFNSIIMKSVQILVVMLVVNISGYSQTQNNVTWGLYSSAGINLRSFSKKAAPIQPLYNYSVGGWVKIKNDNSGFEFEPGIIFVHKNFKYKLEKGIFLNNIENYVSLFVNGNVGIGKSNQLSLGLMYKYELFSGLSFSNFDSPVLNFYLVKPLDEYENEKAHNRLSAAISIGYIQKLTKRLHVKIAIEQDVINIYRQSVFVEYTFNNGQSFKNIELNNKPLVVYAGLQIKIR